ncbi:MAG: hypothetical protein K2H29_11110 [Oscillospiraceae bacterium]|nr:hypothetical protein [Oscillospiraceae bacterium]MDE6088916.1 hypothetical protein [Oscillospiraceae bacterium]
MFYDNLKAICTEKGLKITPVVLECGGTKGMLGGWKNGAVPNSDIIMKLSERLNIPTDVLLFGKDCRDIIIATDEDEQQMLRLFRSLPDKEQIKLLGRAELLAELAMSKDSGQ